MLKETEATRLFCLIFIISAFQVGGAFPWLRLCYSPSCLGHDTAKGLSSQAAPLAHLSTTHDGGFTLFFFVADRQAGKL